MRAAHELDSGLPPVTPRATPLADAVEALGLFASAAIRRFGWSGTSPWRLIAVMTGGRLLAALADG